LHWLPPGDEHDAPELHETQVPAPSHTPLETVDVLHDVPAVATVLSCVQVATPPVHDVVPCMHGFCPVPLGWHGALAMHAAQTPL
jgi:hypothetical protein